MSTKTGRPAEIEFLYFEGCPNAASTLENLRAALEDLKIELDRITITDVKADSYDGPFFGSPSITVNGVDLYTGTRPVSADFSCRIFEFEGKRTGEMPEKFIRERLTDLLGGG